MDLINRWIKNGAADMSNQEIYTIQQYLISTDIKFLKTKFGYTDATILSMITAISRSRKTDFSRNHSKQHYEKHDMNEKN